MKSVAWWGTICFIGLLCTSCYRSYDEMSEQYDRIINDLCDMQIMCDSNVKDEKLQKEACLSVYKESDEIYAAVPECERYYRIATALLFKCPSEFGKEYGKAFCGNHFDGMLEYKICSLKYTSNYGNYNDLLNRCVCRHYEDYEKSDLDEHLKKLLSYRHTCK